MNAETFAEWLRRDGHRVFRSPSSYWVEAGPRVLQAFPYHWIIKPGKEELSRLMSQNGMLAVRYSAPVDEPAGKISYHIVLKAPYELGMLKSQARNGVKGGLAQFQAEQISFERLATEGWQLQRDTLERQDRLRSMSREEWERLCRSAEGLPGFEAWAAVAGGELGAAVIISRIDDIFTVPYAMSRTRSLPEHVNNALFYSVSKEMLGREGIREVFFTVQSLDAPASVDDFKLRMGLCPKPVRQRVEFHPWLRPFVTSTTHGMSARLLQRDPGNPLLAKAEGILRFHVEGKKSLAEQCWPECLAPRRQEILNSIGGQCHGES